MKLNTKEIAVFGMLGAVMFASKMLMEILPNIHLLGTFIVAITVVYRKKALYPIYIYVLLNGIFAGFATWWIPYLYVWTVLWVAIMILPKKMPPKVAPIVYAVVCSLHGFGFGILYAPAQAILYGLNFEQMIAWIIAGSAFDVLHAAGDFAAGLLILPTVKLLRKIDTNIYS